MSGDLKDSSFPVSVFGNTSATTSVAPTVVESSVQPLPHHHQQPLCHSRPRYRQGRRLTAVKAYTISDESIYLLINGVPGLKLQRELKTLCQKYGTVLSLTRLQDYPVEAFAEAHLVKYSSVRESRFAKKMLDGKNFFGGVFHVCYAPELESVDETRQKLEERRRAVLLTVPKQEREKKRLEAALDGEGGSVLCQYHPDDRLASAIKRVTDRLSYNIGPKYQAEITSNLRKDSNNTSINTGLENSDAVVSFGISFNDSRSSNTNDSHLQNVRYTEPPPVIHSASTSNTNSKSGQGPHALKSFVQFANSQQSSRVANPSSSTCDEKLAPSSLSPACEQSNDFPAGVGQHYASMNADYEPGLGRTTGQQYAASNTKNKRNAYSSRKTSVESFTIKPTKAYKRRKLEEDTKAQNGQSGTAQSTFKPKLGYREVVRSLQQQRYRDGDDQLARLQQALHATLGTPTALREVRPAPDRPTTKMKLLADGVKLV